MAVDRPPLPIRRLTPAEMAARREKGLCFNCDSKFTPGHRCRPPQFLCLMVETDVESPAKDDTHPTVDPLPDTEPFEDADEAPCISFHALTRQTVPTTLKLAGSIMGHAVVVLVDGGSTNNFIQARLAKCLGLTVQRSHHLRVTVGNGDSVHCEGACIQIPLKLDQIPFEADLMLLPIHGADVVLGVQWMATLGPILFDYQHLWMEIDWKGARVRFQGVVQPNLQYISASNLAKATRTDDAPNIFS